MALSKTQLDYAFARINAALKAKRDAVTVAHTTPAVAPSSEDFADTLRAGNVPVRGDVSRVWRSDRLDSVFDLSGVFVPACTDEAAVAAIMEPLEKQAQQMKDELVLGDTAAALAAISAFVEACQK